MKNTKLLNKGISLLLSIILLATCLFVSIPAAAQAENAADIYPFYRYIDFSEYTVYSSYNSWSQDGTTYWNKKTDDITADGNAYLRYSTMGLTPGSSWEGNHVMAPSESGGYSVSDLSLPNATTFRVTMRVRAVDLSNVQSGLQPFVIYGYQLTSATSDHGAYSQKYTVANTNAYITADYTEWTEISFTFTTPDEYLSDGTVTYNKCYIGFYPGSAVCYAYDIDSLKLAAINNADTRVVDFSDYVPKLSVNAWGPNADRNASYGPVELLTNNGFETYSEGSFTDWTLWKGNHGETTIEQVDGRTDKAAKITINKNSSIVNLYRSITLDTDSEYVFSAWIKIENISRQWTTAPGLYLKLSYSGTTIASSQTINTDTDWQKIEVVVDGSVLSGDEQSVRVDIVFEYVAGDFYIDDTSLVKKESSDAAPTLWTSVVKDSSALGGAYLNFNGYTLSEEEGTGLDDWYGNYNLILSNDGTVSTTGDMNDFNNIVLPAATSYRFKVRLRLNEVSGNTKLYVTYSADRNSSEEETVIAQNLQAGDWTEYSLVFTTPEAYTTSQNFYFGVTNEGAGNLNYDLDYAVLEKVNAVSVTFNANGGSFNGTDTVTELQVIGDAPAVRTAITAPRYP